MVLQFRKRDKMNKIIILLSTLLFINGCDVLDFLNMEERSYSTISYEESNNSTDKNNTIDNNSTNNKDYIDNNEANATFNNQENNNSNNDYNKTNNSKSTQDSDNNESNITSKSIVSNRAMMIFDDDALGDNDIAQSFSAAMAMQYSGLIDVKAVGISGIDTNNKRSLLISSIAYYYGFKNIPIGISKRDDVRKQWSPFSNYPPLINSYKGINRDLTQFENDSILDNQREDVILTYCRVLSELKEGKKISIAIMGNSYNIESLLKEKNICNGYELIKNRVSRIVMVGGRYDGKWDMNFGAFGEFHKVASASSKYVVEHSPVPIILVDEKAGCGLPGGAYKTYPKVDANSPMSMTLSVKYGTHSKATDNIGCTQDASAILSAALNGKWYNWDLWDEVHGIIHVDSDGRVSFRRDKNSKNIKLFPKSYTNSILNQIFIELAKIKSK